MKKITKHRKHRRSVKSDYKAVLIPIKPTMPIKSVEFAEEKRMITLSDNEQIRYVYKYQQTKNRKHVTEVTSVGYEIKIKDRWETIIYYDNDETHNYLLHRHIRISLETDKTISTTEGVKKKGTSQTIDL